MFSLHVAPFIELLTAERDLIRWPYITGLEHTYILHINANLKTERSGIWVLLGQGGMSFRCHALHI